MIFSVAKIHKIEFYVHNPVTLLQYMIVYFSDSYFPVIFPLEIIVVIIGRIAAVIFMVTVKVFSDDF